MRRNGASSITGDVARHTNTRSATRCRCQRGGRLGRRRGAVHHHHFSSPSTAERVGDGTRRTTGTEQVETDAGGRAVRTLARTAPVAGNNLIGWSDTRSGSANPAGVFDCVEQISCSCVLETMPSCLQHQPGSSCLIP